MKGDNSYRDSFKSKVRGSIKKEARRRMRKSKRNRQPSLISLLAHHDSITHSFRDGSTFQALIEELGWRGRD